VLGWLTKLFSRKPGMDGAWLRPYRFLRGRYDAAVTNDDNRRHWANADGLSANAANNPEVRRVLRNRARYEVANNSYAKGICLTLANDTVGTGPRLQMLTPDAEANHVVEHEFAQWAQAVRLAEKLCTMRLARAGDGEAFAVLTNNDRLPAPVTLDLRLVEADQVCTPDLIFDSANAVDGILFDELGNAVEYHLLRYHPGDVRALFNRGYDRLPASAVIHYFRTDRPGQARGIPDITPALPLFAQLRRFTLAVLAAAETAADFAGILYTDAPANGEAEAVEPMDTIELEHRALLTMPGGWKMSQLRAEQPSTGYSEFKKEILNEIARCLNIPYKIRGKFHYFGTWDNPQAALDLYLDQKDDLHAGRPPRSDGDSLTLRELVNAFLASKRADMEMGRNSPRTFNDYHRVCSLLVNEFGAARAVSDIRPTDFERLYNKLALKYRLSTVGRHVTTARSVFKYAFDNFDHVARPVNFGSKFKVPSKADRRMEKARARQQNGRRMFAAEEIRSMLAGASDQLKAMILLGINGGLGNSDLAALPISALDLDGGWLDFPRVKTGIERRIPLWPETRNHGIHLLYVFWLKMPKAFFGSSPESVGAQSRGSGRSGTTCRWIYRFSANPEGGKSDHGKVTPLSDGQNVENSGNSSLAALVIRQPTFSGLIEFAIRCVRFEDAHKRLSREKTRNMNRKCEALARGDIERNFIPRLRFAVTMPDWQEWNAEFSRASARNACASLTDLVAKVLG